MSHHRNESAYTTIELIVVIILIGILSAVIIPRWIGKSSFEGAGLSATLSSSILFARQIALAQTSSTVNLIISSDRFSVEVDGSAVARPSGNGDFPLLLSEFSSGGLSLSPATTISFDSLGGVASAQTIVVNTGTETLQLCLETTGYVRDC